MKIRLIFAYISLFFQVIGSLGFVIGIPIIATLPFFDGDVLLWVLFSAGSCYLIAQPFSFVAAILESKKEDDS